MAQVVPYPGTEKTRDQYTDMREWWDVPGCPVFHDREDQGPVHLYVGMVEYIWKL